MGAVFGQVHKSESEFPTDLVRFPAPINSQSAAYSLQIFPPELKSYSRKMLHIQFHDRKTNETVSWYHPDTLEAALKLKADVPHLRCVVGATEVSVERTLKHVLPANYLYLSDLPELTKIEISETGVKFGASVSLSRILSTIRGLMETMPEHKVRGFVAMREQLRWFGSNQIRNVSSLAGNIATASPISYAPHFPSRR